MTCKIEAFIKRNRKRNAHLYNDSLVLNEDYVICPHTKERVTMIKSTYITSVLGMTVEEYDALYPGVLKEAPARGKKVNAALSQVDPLTGKTKREVAVDKQRKTRTTVGEDGLTPAQRGGYKSAKMKSETILSNGLTLAQDIAARAVLKGNATKAANGSIQTANSDEQLYTRLVKYLLTAKFGKSGFELKLKIVDGYRHQVSPLIMASESNIANLQNFGETSHSWKSAIGADELVNINNYTASKSTAEFNLALDLLRECVDEHGQLSCGVIIEKLNNAEVRKKYGL